MRLFAVVVGILSAGCADPAPAVPPAPTAPPLPGELAALGPFARPTAVQGAGQLGPAGGQVALSDGALLFASPGAVAAPLDVTVQRVDVDLFEMAYESTSAYVVRSAMHVPAFGAPVFLQVPLAGDLVVASVFEGGQWTSVPVAPGPAARISVAHLSERAVVVRRRWVEELTPVRQETVQGRNESRQLVATGSPASILFFGVGETQRQTSRELCDEIARVIAQPGLDFGYPPGESWRDVNPIEWANRNLTLAGYLHSNAVPEQIRGRYWDMTAGYMRDIEQRLLATTAPVTPAGMLQICLDSTNDNVPLAVLACHNYLKNLTEKGRYAPSGLVPEAIGTAVSHLQTWRHSDRSRAGFYDKMGPLYHVFATMTAGTWSLMSGGGYAAAYIETFLRLTGSQGDPEDPDKESADRCGADIGANVRRGGAGQAFGITTPTPPAQPPEALPPIAPVSGDGDGGVAAPFDGDLAATADGGTSDGDGDGGVPDPFHVEPAPASTPQSWAGRWRGRGRLTAFIPGVGATANDATVEVTTVIAPSGAVRLTYGLGGPTETIELTLTPSNPNAGRGRKEVAMPPPAPGVTVSAVYIAVAFLREGKLYLTVRQETHSTAVVQGPAGARSGEADMPSDLIAILDRVP